MFLISISPFLLDFITILIIIAGLITGFFVGLRALLFITIGNGIAIGLAFAFKSLLLARLEYLLNGWFSSYNNQIGTLIVGNLAPLIYFSLWLLVVNLIFWVIYWGLKGTYGSQHQIKHQVVNSISGAFLNTWRMMVVAGVVVLLAGSGIFANQRDAKINQNYLTNNIAEHSVMYQGYSVVGSDWLLTTKQADLKGIAELQNYSLMFTYATRAVKSAPNSAEVERIVDQFNQLIPFTNSELSSINEKITDLKNNQSHLKQNINAIAGIMQNHVINDLLDLKYMGPVLDMIQRVITLYPHATYFFVNSFYLLRVTVDTSKDPNWNQPHSVKARIMELLNFLRKDDPGSGIANTFQYYFESLYQPF